MRMYAACLASYNNGVHHGQWFDLEDFDDADALQEAIAEKVLRTSPFPNVEVEVECSDCQGAGRRVVNGHDAGACGLCWGKGTRMVPSAEEWAAHDWDGDGLSEFGEYPNLEDVYESIRLTNEHGPAWAAFKGAFGDSVTEANFEEAYRGQYDSLADYTEEFMKEAHGLKGDEPFFYWIDWERAANDMSCDFTFTDGYVFCNHW